MALSHLFANYGLNQSISSLQFGTLFFLLVFSCSPSHNHQFVYKVIGAVGGRVVHRCADCIITKWKCLSFL